jgi:hypothetical protein
MPYEVITPMIQNLTVRGTSINSEIRTITGKSINGNEIPYADKGYESVSINIFIITDTRKHFPVILPE